MSNLRFRVGASVMCNMGPDGWKLGRVIALHYREDHWPRGKEAPYQVMLDANHGLIYVPADEPAYCREATAEDQKIAQRIDALAPLPDQALPEPPEPRLAPTNTNTQLGCANATGLAGNPSYRSGHCQGCARCPRDWSSVELYSEHYRCAARNGLKVTRHTVDLGTIRVGGLINHPAALGPDIPWRQEGFMQCPTLVRLPPGVRFTDDGALAGKVRFDPYRGRSYRVEFVAVSTASWEDPAVGIVRQELSFLVEGNDPPGDFDLDAFMEAQQQACEVAKLTVRDLVNTWLAWEAGDLSNRDTCDQMLADLGRLRELLEAHPRLDGGMWWTQLGGFHMNVHKLLENTLFECELYLGHALTFGDAEVRCLAEQNLEGCYQKRLLEAARFMWIDGIKQMMQGEWATAADTLRSAAAKKEGWGWAVNYGDIWLSEAAARLVHGAMLSAGDGAAWIRDAAQLLEKGQARANESHVFGSKGHPWAAEIAAALASYHRLQRRGADTAEWLEAFTSRTIYWCAQVLGGAAPFPPKPRPRLEDATALVRRLPGHNDTL